jgi:hypothetical protein
MIDGMALVSGLLHFNTTSYTVRTYLVQVISLTKDPLIPLLYYRIALYLYALGATLATVVIPYRKEFDDVSLSPSLCCSCRLLLHISFLI